MQISKEEEGRARGRVAIYCMYNYHAWPVAAWSACMHACMVKVIPLANHLHYCIAIATYIAIAMYMAIASSCIILSS